MDWDVCGANIVFCGIFSVVYIIFTILYEYTSAFSFCSLSWGEGKVIAEVEREAAEQHREVRDQDVLDEEERVRSNRSSRSGAAAASTGAASDVVIVDGFKKVYPNGKYAVRGVSLGMPNGECFGLLGINGAGMWIICACSCSCSLIVLLPFLFYFILQLYLYSYQLLFSPILLFYFILIPSNMYSPFSQANLLC